MDVGNVANVANVVSVAATLARDHDCRFPSGQIAVYVEVSLERFDAFWRVLAAFFAKSWVPRLSEISRKVDHCGMFRTRLVR